MTGPDVAKLLAERAEDVCRHLLPNGVRRGREWKVGSVHGEAGDSLGIVLSGDKAGVWQDFAAGESGDLIGLWKAVRGVDTAEAFKEAEAFLGIEPRKLNGSAHGSGHKTIPAPTHIHPRLGRPSRTWAYTDAYGAILGYVSRFDPPGERKQILPETLVDGVWSWKGFAEPRPLYGLERLALHPAAKIVVVEGEKAADAAQALLPEMVAVTWPGGAQAVGKADIAPLRGRAIVLWPDADEPGRAAMTALRDRLAQPCRELDVEGMPDGWDAADALEAGWDTGKLLTWARPRLKEWFPPVPEEGPEPLVSDYPIAMLEDEDEPPEPTNFFEQMPLPKLGRSCLPPALADFIFDQSQIIGSDPCILALSALVACAAVTSDSIKIQPKEFEVGWKESARLWGAFVGDPSVKKTPPLNRAVAHLRKLDMEFAERAAEAMARYKIARKVYEAQEKRFIDDSAKNRPVGPLPDPPERPPQRRIVVQDSTIEALSDVLADNPQGVLVLMDELSGFFGAMDAYRAQGSKDKAFWLEAYNGGPRRVDRVSREARLVPNLSTCILGGIQPDAIRQRARDMTEDGLLQRFIVVIAQSGESIGEDRRADSGAAQAYRGILDWLVTCEGDPERPVRFSAEARAVLARVERKLNAFAKEDRLPLRMRYQLGKWSGLFCRLCLTYWAIECANLGLAIEGEITADVAERVESFLFEFLFWHLRHFYETILGDSTKAADLTEKVGLWILAKTPPRITSSMLSNGVREWRTVPWKTRRDVFDTLETCGWIMPEPRRGNAGPSWIVNSKVFSTFAELGESERKRRSAIRDAIMGIASDEAQRSEYE